MMGQQGCIKHTEYLFYIANSIIEIFHHLKCKKCRPNSHTLFSWDMQETCNMSDTIAFMCFFIKQNLLRYTFGLVFFMDVKCVIGLQVWLILVIYYLMLKCNRHIINAVLYSSQCIRFPTMWYVRPAKSQTSLFIRLV